MASLELRRDLTAVEYEPLKAREATAACRGALRRIPGALRDLDAGRLDRERPPRQREDARGARSVLAEAFPVLLDNIDRTEGANDGSLDILDLTPLHQHMYASVELGPSGIRYRSRSRAASASC